MKFLIPLILINAFVLTSCTGSRTSVKEDTGSPCNDSLYLALQKKDTSSFTPAEKNYFFKFRDECSEEKKQAEIADMNKTVLAGLGGLAVLLGLAYYVALLTQGPIH